MTLPLYLALRDAVVSLGDQSFSASSSYLDMERLIQQGAPLTPPDPDYPGLIKPLIAAMRRHGERVHPHMRLLVEAGANPMLDGLFKAAMEEDEEIGDYLLRAMFDAQTKGKPMFDEHGASPLHALMATNWESSSNSMRWMKDRYHPAWINAVDAQGRTPLRVLWEPVAFRPTRFSGLAMRRLWRESVALVGQGAQLHDRSAGLEETTAETILRCVDMGVQVPADASALVEQARALVEHQALDQATGEGQTTAPRRRI